MGRFFAGVFAPLAFLWLVLGYLQQGEELKLSTRALLLQADELKLSVQQQRELVEVTRQQVVSEKEAIAYEREMRERAALPHFVVAGGGGSFSGDGSTSYGISITNSGNVAVAVLGVAYLGEQGNHRLIDLPMFASGATHQVRLELTARLTGLGARFLLSYRDALGHKFADNFSIGKQNDGPHSGLSFERLDASDDDDAPS